MIAPDKGVALPSPVRQLTACLAGVFVAMFAATARGQTISPAQPSGIPAAAPDVIVASASRLHRVIVAMKGIPAGEPARIAAARQRILDAIAPYRHRVNRSYDAIPALALTVDDDALRVLQMHPDVASVADDGRTRAVGHQGIR